MHHGNCIFPHKFWCQHAYTTDLSWRTHYILYLFVLMIHLHACHFLFFQSDGATADALLPQWRPVPARGHRLRLGGLHALSPRVTGALPATGPARLASTGGPGHAHYTAQREGEGAREGERAGATSIQRRRGKRRGSEERGGTGAPDRLKGGGGVEGWEGRVAEEDVCSLLTDSQKKKDKGWRGEMERGSGCRWKRKKRLC